MIPHLGLLSVLLLLSPPILPGDEAFPRATPESQGLSSEALEALAAEVEEYLERDFALGAELLVVQNRHTVLHRCFGVMDREGEEAEPWVDGTVCNIRSMTKPLTGAAVQVLVDRGKLSLDDPVAKFLPGFDTDAAREITVRQLLTHRAGLPLTVLTAMDEFESLHDLGNAVGAKGPDRAPGSRFWYSDCGADALGAVVEVVAERKLDAFVREELLEPLAMSESFYFHDDEDPRRPRIASLYIGGPGRWERFLDPDDGAFYPFAWGSQSLYATPEDYARFLAMWMDGGRVGERQVLSPAAVERTLTPVSEMTMLGSETRFPTSFSGLEVYYGQMAVLHVPEGSGGKEPAVVIGHSGSDGTIAWAWPERDLMILYFTQSRGGGSALRLEAAIDRLLIHPEAYADAGEVPEELREVLGTYVADWSNHMKEEFVVQYESGRLSIDVPSQMVFQLKPAEQDGRWTFAIAPGQINVWFERDEAGNVDCLRIQQGPMTFEAPRQGTPHEAEVAAANRPDPAVVGKLLGRYHDPQEDEDVEVFVDGDYLAVRTEQYTFHLWKVPVADVWQVRENPFVSLTFQEEDGAVVSVTRSGADGSELVLPRLP